MIILLLLLMSEEDLVCGGYILHFVEKIRYLPTCKSLLVRVETGESEEGSSEGGGTLPGIVITSLL
jgi:hypothetical protein